MASAVLRPILQKSALHLQKVETHNLSAPYTTFATYLHSISVRAFNTLF